MAHDRNRSVAPLYQKLIQSSPILGIFGHRQVGKTTYMNQVTPHYLTFDSIMTLKRAQSDPEEFIRSLKKSPFGIDECQMVPDLFPAIKEHVRKNKRPGQFILSGSVRFTSRKAIRESLAGRMIFFELYPLTISELDQRPLPEFFTDTIHSNAFSESTFESLNATSLQKRNKSINVYLKKGGLPGLCFLREDRLMRERLIDLHRLILDRDLRMVHETQISVEVMMSYIKLIADSGLNGYSYSHIKRELGLSPVTQKALLFALESIFLIRRIPIYGGSKGEIIFLEDQYEEVALRSSTLSLTEQLTGLIYRNLRAEFQYRLGSAVTIKSYWTRNNARVPLVISQTDKTLGVICIDGDEPNLSQIRAAESLLRVDASSKVVFLSRSASRPQVLNSRLAIVPMGAAI
jgi:predicted AAA+ superfamily ATPase